MKSNQRKFFMGRFVIMLLNILPSGLRYTNIGTSLPEMFQLVLYSCLKGITQKESSILVEIKNKAFGKALLL